MSTTAIPIGIQQETPTARKRPISKKRYEPLRDVEIQFASVIIIALIYLQIAINQNISASMKGTLVILATVILMAFFWDQIERVARKWWHRSLIGFNTLYYFDPADRSLKEVVVPRWRVLHTELPENTLAISIPLGGFLNTPCVVMEHRKITDLWRLRKREDIKTPLPHIQLVDQFKDGVSLPIDQALIFLESKQQSLEFFPNWAQEFLNMHDDIFDLSTKLAAHSNECRGEYINELKAEIERFEAERTKLREAQKKLSIIVNKSTRAFSPQQFIELIIRAFMAQEPEGQTRQEETQQEHQECAQDSDVSVAA